jgi:hypothetical protein
MYIVRLGLFLGLIALPLVAKADTVAADNLIYDPFQFSGFREDIGYEHTVNGGFPNTAAAQPFVSLASGPLKSIASLIAVDAGGEPLQVSIRQKTPSGMGALLGMAEFPATLFPSSYATNPPTELNMESSGVELVAGQSYFVVFTTETPVHASARYNMHVMPPTAKSFGMEHWFSRDSVTYSPVNIGGDYELPILVNVVPEPSVLMLLLIGGAVVGGRLLIARRSIE